MNQEICDAIRLEPHNPEWASEFAKHRVALERLLTGIPILSIEHVGSTSIPDLIAKPILDIDIVIDSSSFFDTYMALVGQKYKYIGTCHIPDRHSFFQPDSNEDGVPIARGVMRRNTYVMYKDCKSLKNHRDLKRILMEDDDLRKEYGEVKRKLVEEELISDLDKYCVGKNEIVKKILRKAGWTDEELKEVQKTRFY